MAAVLIGPTTKTTNTKNGRSVKLDDSPASGVEVKNKRSYISPPHTNMLLWLAEGQLNLLSFNV
jgi:hypothetical protein